VAESPTRRGRRGPAADRPTTARTRRGPAADLPKRARTRRRFDDIPLIDGDVDSPDDDDSPA
jgi:hypothetical protein